MGGRCSRVTIDIRDYAIHLFGLPLALFVTGVGADHTNDALAPNNFAILAKLFHRCSDFHKFKLFAAPQGCGLQTNQKVTVATGPFRPGRTAPYSDGPFPAQNPVTDGHWPI